LKSKGTYDDSIRINRRSRRKLKIGKHPYVLIFFILEQKRMEKREMLAQKEKHVQI